MLARELTFDPGGALGLFLGRLQLHLDALALGDIDDDAEQADHFARLVPGWNFAGQDHHLPTLVVVGDLLLVQQRLPALHGRSIETTIALGVLARSSCCSRASGCPCLSRRYSRGCCPPRTARGPARAPASARGSAPRSELAGVLAIPEGTDDVTQPNQNATFQPHRGPPD